MRRRFGTDRSCDDVVFLHGAQGQITGEFHFLNEKAAEIACETVIDFLIRHSDSMERGFFNVFKDSDRQIYEKILAQV